MIKQPKPVVLFDIDYTLFNTQKFKESKLQNYNAYNETVGTLVQLKGLVNLGIFSKGETRLQKTKLEETGMIKFFNEKDIHIFDDKDANLSQTLRKYEDTKLFLVDDKLSTLCFAKKLMPQVITIWVKRGPYAMTQEGIAGFTPDTEVENLSEVAKIVQLEIGN